MSLLKPTNHDANDVLELRRGTGECVGDRDGTACDRGEQDGQLELEAGGRSGLLLGLGRGRVLTCMREDELVALYGPNGSLTAWRLKPRVRIASTGSAGWLGAPSTAPPGARHHPAQPQVRADLGNWSPVRLARERDMLRLRAAWPAQGVAKRPLWGIPLPSARIYRGQRRSSLPCGTTIHTRLGRPE